MSDDILVSSSTTYKNFSFPQKSETKLALDDWRDGIKGWRMWWMLSWQDIRLQYRRSILGPFWITLSMGITITALGLLYGKLFKMDLSNYFPFLATGLLGWGLISSSILEGQNVFIDSEHLLKQMKQPYSMYVFRTFNRVFLAFLHNFLIMLPVAMIFKIDYSFSLLFFPIALLLIAINAVTYSTILSLLSTRYRDIKQIIASMIQVVFFLTPVMWVPELIPDTKKFIMAYNPFAQFLEIFRFPLLGKMPSTYAINFVLCITVFGVFFAFLLFRKFRSRISYWL